LNKSLLKVVGVVKYGTLPDLLWGETLRRYEPMPEVRIYTSSYCPYCTAAKQLLSSLGAEFEEVRLDQHPELRRTLSEQHNGWRTVPMVFIDDEFLGGFSEIKQLHERGELEPKLHAR